MYTIIITCRRKPELLKTCLSNIKSKLSPQIIVFNIDPIDDEITQICKQYGAEINIVNNSGFAKSFNDGINLARFDYIIYCQDDVIPTEYCFDRLYETYKNTPYLMMTPNVIEESNGDLERCNGIRDIIYSENYAGRLFACFIITKQKFIEAGELDPNFYPCYFDDRDFLYRNMVLKSNRIGAVCDIKVRHIPASTMRNMDNFVISYDRNNEYYKRKWGGEQGKEIFKIPFDGKEAVKW